MWKRKKEVTDGNESGLTSHMRIPHERTNRKLTPWMRL